MKRILWFCAISVFVISESVPDELQDLPEKKNGKEKVRYARYVVSTFWLFFIIVTLLTFFAFYNTVTVFNVNADAEKVVVSQYVESQFPSWHLNSALLFDGCTEKSESYTGPVNINQEAEIEFLRTQQGPLEITLYNEESSVAGYITTTEGEKRELTFCATFRINPEKAIVLPIEGAITLGSEIKEDRESTPLLLSGSVFLIDKSFLFDELYSVGPFPLMKGDLFVIKSQSSKSYGFVSANPKNGVSVSYQASASRGYIERYKTEKIEIRNGILSRIYHDQSLIVLWLIVVFVYQVCQFFLRRICIPLKLNNHFDAR